MTFHRQGDPAPRLGLDNRDGSTYTDLTARFPEDPAFGSMLAFIDAGAPALEKAWEAFLKLDGAFLVEQGTVTLLSPFRPRRLRDCGLIVAHLRPSMLKSAQWLAANTDAPSAMELYTAFDPIFAPHYDPAVPPLFVDRDPATACAPGAVLTWPAESAWMDYELELAVVIGKAGTDIAPENAADHVFGYTVYNDWTLRDIQAANMRRSGEVHGDAKDFPDSNSFGPCVVTKDEIPDPRNLAMTVRVNGEVWGAGSSARMIHSFEDAVVAFSRNGGIKAGEVWGTGTVPDGSSFELGKRLPRPAFVELEIEGIGKLSHYVVPQA
ncbi:fumarylacetoacetate hydrolase family protein [Tsukamurella pseudospumae]|uniref:fumarylacetoacetate hydrolase family protein n=1 Tax=Tsukamurella pseudospumae TaxID=239498 RepID=UPI001112A6FF|nr:fumarylacetoacetate hydrolase family protein [Tsukamurella pseudospumae]